MNPEEGELRPQLLDRFGLCVQVAGIDDPLLRVAVMERRPAFDEDPAAFCRSFAAESAALAERIHTAMAHDAAVTAGREEMLAIARLSVAVKVDGHRADIVTLKAAKTLCAYEARTVVEQADIDRAAEMALPHRLRRQPFEGVEPFRPPLERKAGWWRRW